MKKSILVLNALAVVAAVGITVKACMPRAHAASAPQAHLGADVVLSATPDDASLAPQWRVDFVPQRGNRQPPFAGRLLVYHTGQLAPTQVIGVTAHVALAELQLSMPDVDGDGHPDLVFAGVRDRVFGRQADAVFLWSAPRGQFVLAPELSRVGTVFPSDSKPGCVSAEFWCADTGVDLLEMCRQPGTGRWAKTPNPHPVCEDRD